MHLGMLQIKKPWLLLFCIFTMIFSENENHFSNMYNNYPREKYTAFHNSITTARNKFCGEKKTFFQQWSVDHWNFFFYPLGSWNLVIWGTLNVKDAVYRVLNTKMHEFCSNAISSEQNQNFSYNINT